MGGRKIQNDIYRVVNTGKQQHRLFYRPIEIIESPYSTDGMTNNRLFAIIPFNLNSQFRLFTLQSLFSFIIGCQMALDIRPMAGLGVTDEQANQTGHVDRVE